MLQTSTHNEDVIGKKLIIDGQRVAIPNHRGSLSTYIDLQDVYILNMVLFKGLIIKDVQITYYH